ncbi:hypothetical protein [Shewanella xiamenensis]|uniref:hypothetical protein n=1 Tax=Shewanella xiamenensis TaxID=332186 RepID=UPI002949DE83|nr:hypothetical protein [Shewanella xiamenensis]MDV5246400.1 hypothetical protein [Shewanella xiamenensis]
MTDVDNDGRRWQLHIDADGSCMSTSHIDVQSLAAGETWPAPMARQHTPSPSPSLVPMTLTSKVKAITAR